LQRMAIAWVSEAEAYPGAAADSRKCSPLSTIR
jgi:hypothetical protein